LFSKGRSAAFFIVCNRSPSTFEVEITLKTSTSAFLTIYVVKFF